MTIKEIKKQIEMRQRLMIKDYVKSVKEQNKSGEYEEIPYYENEDDDLIALQDLLHYRIVRRRYIVLFLIGVVSVCLRFCLTIT